MANRGIALSTAGVTVGYAVETEVGVRPTTGYTLIPDLKEIPDFNPEPETLEATDLEETEYKFYVMGLKDIGGALGFTANFTDKLQTSWEALVEAHEEGIAANKRTWFEIKHPKLAKSVYFPGEPSSMGLPAMSTSSIMETSVYIVPTGAPEWNTKSTT